MAAASTSLNQNPSSALDTGEQGAQGSTCAVIGAGVIGAAIAWHLRLAGFTVTIFDPAPGQDASYAAAGMLAPVTETQYGQEDLWELMTAARKDYPGFLNSLEQAGHRGTGYRDTPTLMIAADRGDYAAMSELAQIQQGFGMDVQPLTGSTLRRQEPALSPVLAKSWLVPEDHQVDPRMLLKSSLAALTGTLPVGSFPEAGPPGRLIHGTVAHVNPSEDHQPGYRLSWRRPAAAQDGDIQQADYDAVVLSPGMGYQHIKGIPEQHPLPLRRVYGEVLRLRVRPEQLEPGETQLISSVIRARVAGRPVYLVPRADGGIVLGASSREDDIAATSAGAVAELLADAIRVLPAIRQMDLEEITTRARPGTPDDRPYLGALTPDGRVLAATGFFRHGILLAPQAARLSRELLLRACADPARNTDPADNEAAAGLSAADQRLLGITDPFRYQHTA